jgi:hypothetical protein
MTRRLPAWLDELFSLTHSNVDERRMVFDPTNVKNGIDLSADPVYWLARPPTRSRKIAAAEGE